ncbi:dihydroorotase [Litorivicinus lipolyticus]|uniref:Dihydroorotase n=1 Tax=Litorivicinus lipolyticus TaxID=418701 RepID=A0A5Q2Q973_9GAMM|nr:dihydroorotase [Litorivicinus lipolyticus]QGG80768.1 dihydroorotase [Litorivicinus lipolyticus]
MNSITIARPDDWHVHLRDDDMLEQVVEFTARQFARAIVMPNLKPPVINIERAIAYRDRILAACPEQYDFTPLMTAYLTDTTDPAELERGFAAGVLTAVKLYPANATTNSAAGVSSVDAVRGCLEVMQRIGMPLLVHGEVVDPAIDIFDREAVFLERVLAPMIADFPALKVVLEHITTADSVDFIMASTTPLAATITAHHLQVNRNHMLVGGIRPHYYCLPIVKRASHQQALRDAATGGDTRFFLGTDTAPHPITGKHSACGCAGVFTAPCALESYVQVFDEENALDKFEAFASFNGPAFYGLPVNTGTLTLTRTPTKVGGDLGEGDAAIRPYRMGETLPWSVA